MTISAERIQTTQMLIDELDMWDEFTVKSLKNNHQARRYYNIINNLIDQQINAGIDWMNTPEAKQYFYQEAEYTHELFESLEDQWDTILSGKYSNVDGLINEVYNQGKLQGYNTIEEHLKYTEADKLALAFAKNYNFQLIQNLDDDLRNAVKNTIIESQLTGEHPYNISNKLLNLGIKPLEGTTLSPKQRATMIARTETSRVQNTGILQSYVNEGYTEVTILTAEDDKVCTACLELAYKYNKNDIVIFDNRGEERVHKIEDIMGAIPVHPNCRCTVLAVWESKNKAPENPMVINLTPLKFHNMSNGDPILQYVQLTEDKFPEDLPDLLKERSLEFDALIEDAKKEYVYIDNLTTGEVGKIYSGEKTNVTPQSDIHINFEDELSTAHNHVDHMPFNYKDFQVIFEDPNIYVKYLLVHTPTDIFICELKENARYYCEEITAELNECYGDGLIEGRGNNYVAAGKILEKYKSNKLLNKYMSFRRVRK